MKFSSTLPSPLTILLLTLTLLISLSAQAQFKDNPILPKGDSPASFPIPKVRLSQEQQNVHSPRKIIYKPIGQLPFEQKGPLAVTRYSTEGIALAIEGNIPQQKSSSWDTKTQQWLDASSEIMGTDSHTSFEPQDTWTDNIGHTHIKLSQHQGGIKVFGGEIILHAIDGAIIKQNGPYVPATLLPTHKSKTMTEDAAKQHIIADLPNYKTNWNSLAKMSIAKDAQQWTGELVFYKHQEQYRLAYNYVVFANLAERYEYLIDASTGEILNKWSTICKICYKATEGCNSTCTHESSNSNSATKINPNPTATHVKIPQTNSSTLMPPPPDGPAVGNARDLLAITREVNTYELGNRFFMIDASRDMYNTAQSNIPEDPVGAIWTIDIGNQSPSSGNATYDNIVSNNNGWTDSREGVSAHYNAGKAYDYFKDVHGRNSITGTGQTIVSIVNVTDDNGQSMGNAFYNSLAIWYGNGDNTFFPLGRALDVAGHELTHGVVENTANLIYQNQSGAMNESFADIFGAMIDDDDWLIGEDVVKPGVFPGNALRNIKDPHNGANTGDFGRGWQPKHMNERYTGSEDNGGVHLNSGIPNYAYYLFATEIGIDKAEKVYYRALSTYLTRSSDFSDLRFAVESAASDLYGSSARIAAGNAFASVGVGQATQPDYEDDITINSGDDLMMSSNLEKTRIYIDNLNTGDIIFNPLSSTSHISKPSITDNGRQVVFVGEDNNVYLINIDWTTNPPTSEEVVFLNDGNWRNVVISKDGTRLALLEKNERNNIVLYDDNLREFKSFTLFNPSYTNGLETGEVVLADGMEFDLTGDVLIYDALNELSSSISTESISYWDIGFLSFWESGQNTWVDVTQQNYIDKLFGSLPENVSVGNPTYSKNSPYIVAFDVRTLESTGDYTFQLFGMNTEANDRQGMITNGIWAYPSYSKDDTRLVLDFGDGAAEGLAIADLNDNKITANAITEYDTGIRWATWFSNGQRELPSDTEDLTGARSGMTLSPNPVNDVLNIKTETIETGSKVAQLEVLDASGRIVDHRELESHTLLNYSLKVNHLDKGIYFIKIRSGDNVWTQKFIKV